MTERDYIIGRLLEIQGENHWALPAASFIADLPPFSGGERPVTGQGTLVPGPGQHRRDDPATSKAAANMDIGGRTTKRFAVFAAIARAGHFGATATELEQATGIEYRTLTPRIGELKRWGWVTTNGLTRPGDHGAQQDVNVLTSKGTERALADGIVLGQRSSEPSSLDLFS